MKKLLLFAIMCVFGLCAVNAQEADTLQVPNADSIYLICERFDNYEVGDKIAAKGNDCWSTWSGKEGAVEDGLVAADSTGNKYAHFKKGNDQVLFLGNYNIGCYEIEFDVYVPNGKSGYFNFLHYFAGSSSTWAMQSYLHMKDDGGQTAQVQSPGHGTIHAAGNSVADLECIYDAWMHFRFVIDIDRDWATFLCTMPNAEEDTVVEWQWSKNSFDDVATVNRYLDAMNFYPPLNTSEFYLDNFTLRKTNGDTAPEISFPAEQIQAGAMYDDLSSVEVTVENTGTSVADYTAWIEYGVGADSDNLAVINYDAEINEKSQILGFTFKEKTIIELGAKYTASAYSSSVAGTKITHISYPFIETEEGKGYGIVEGDDIVFRIYKQGYNGQPGECLAEKVVAYSEIKESGWFTAELDEPVLLSGFDVWATVSLSSPAEGAYPMLFDGIAENLVPYGDVVRFNNEGDFFLMSEVFEAYGNTHIRITCTGDPVFGGWAELENVDGIVPMEETSEIKINFNTFGLEGGKTYEAKLVIAVNNTDDIFEAPLYLRIWGEDVEEVLNNAYNIYPNPTTGMVTVEGENIEFVTVYNSVGQLVKVVKTQNNVVDMSAYDNGVYFFNVVNNAGQSSVQRVVVAK